MSRQTSGTQKTSKGEPDNGDMGPGVILGGVWRDEWSLGNDTVISVI